MALAIPANREKSPNLRWDLRIQQTMIRHILSLVANSQCSLLMFPSSDTKLHLYEAANLTFTVEADQPLDDVVLTLTSSDPSVVQLDSASMQISQLIPGENFSALLTPLQIGYADLAWEFVDKIGNDSSAGIHSMRVVREQTAFAMGFGAIIGLLVALNNVNVGCQLDMQVVLAQLKKPVAPTIGMLGQFVFMPLVMFSFNLSFAKPDDVAGRLGLFTIGSCPGGVYSNFYTLLLQGDLDLSVTMTFISNVGALGMMPFWMHTLGHKLSGPTTPAVPFSNLIVSLVALTIPLGIGLLIQYKRPKWGKASERIVKPFSVAILLVALVVGIYSYWYIATLITLLEVAAASVVVVSGFAFGAGMAWLARLNPRQIIAVSLETAIQNGPLAIVILTFSLPEPSGDLAVVPVAVLVTLSIHRMKCTFCTRRSGGDITLLQCAGAVPPPALRLP
ncbi:hypothetical protein HPB47_008863 [Ixodes persulcatus]|uniref:Uncharacterized protein n=1 Tax=Ixodes persulcatus TaxID=34615 RepID=A0AC60P3L2_IXOPE|nr:hypothetical protein HPB47_008863 [Ixodes persulcatus]